MANVVLGAGSVPRSAIITASAKYNGNSQINLEADNININSTPITDFVVAEGTSNSWHYRKWNSGKAECWCRVVTSGFTSGWVAHGNNYVKLFEKPLPFTGKQFISAQVSTDYYGYATVENARSTTWLTKFSTNICESMGSEGVDQDHAITMYWLGTWK